MPRLGEWPCSAGMLAIIDIADAPTYAKVTAKWRGCPGLLAEDVRRPVNPWLETASNVGEGIPATTADG